MENPQNLQAQIPMATGVDKNAQEDTGKVQPTALDLQNWLVSYLAQELEIEPNKIDITIPFDRYGLESSAAVTLTGDLGDWLGCELDPTLLYDYPTIESVARYLVKIEQ